LIACAGTASSGGRFPAELNREGQASVLGFLLAHPELLPLDGEIGTVCVGLGRDGGAMPPLDFLRRFGDNDPPVMASVACDRTLDPESGKPVIRDPRGSEGLFVLIDDYSEMTEVKVERTGSDPRNLLCTLNPPGKERKIPFVAGTLPASQRSPRPIPSAIPEYGAIQVLGCRPSGL
jgi:hypothetical protein